MATLSASMILAAAVNIRRVTLTELEPIWNGIVADDLNPQPDGEWYGAFEGAQILGASHLVDVEGDELLDDLWVRPDRRGTGVGRSLVRDVQDRRPSLWLIADPDGVAYYERLGFRVTEPLPQAIAKRYEALGLWPGHLDHLHVAMRWKKP